MNRLKEIFDSHQGKVSDKWETYLHVYDRVFSSFRNEPVSLLEIGVQNGGSLEIWAKYFGKAQCIVGCDIDENCESLSFEEDNISFCLGDAMSSRIQQEISDKSKDFDIIIDDGSHRSGDICSTFLTYFPRLKDGGIYVVEDLHCSYWKEFDGGLYFPYSSIAFFKKLVDVVNCESWGVNLQKEALIAGFASHYKLKVSENALDGVYSVSFFNSMCIVYKGSETKASVGQRLITGVEEVVTNSLATLPSSIDVPPQRSGWSTMRVPPEEDWRRAIDESEKLASEVRQLASEVDVISQQKESLEDLIDSITSSYSWKLTYPYRWFADNVKAFFAKVVKRGG